MSIHLPTSDFTSPLLLPALWSWRNRSLKKIERIHNRAPLKQIYRRSLVLWRFSFALFIAHLRWMSAAFVPLSSVLLLRADSWWDIVRMLTSYSLPVLTLWLTYTWTLSTKWSPNSSPVSKWLAPYVLYVGMALAFWWRLGLFAAGLIQGWIHTWLPHQSCKVQLAFLRQAFCLLFSNWVWWSLAMFSDDNECVF